MIFITSQ